MKTAVSCILWILYCVSAKAQSFIDSCDFESPCPYLAPFGVNNIWEVGVPEKTQINVAKSPNFCVVSDAITPVGVNRRDTLQFNILTKLYGDYPPNGMYIQFYYNCDLALFKDVCTIEIGFDDSDFKNLKLRSEQEGDTEYFENVEYYLPKYIEVDGDTGFSGNTSPAWQSGWIHISFYYSSDPSPNGWPPDVDTVKLRFILKTDTIFETQDGFAIDDIEIDRYYQSAIQQSIGIESFRLAPNPVSNVCALTCQPMQNTSQSVKLLDPGGKFVVLYEDVYFDANGKATITTEALAPGAYLCVIDAGTTSYTQLLIKQ